MFLSKRSNGIYYIFFDQPNGKRTCISTRMKTKKDALLAYARFAEEQRRKLSETFSTIPLKQFTIQFLKYSSSFHTFKTTLTYKTTFNAMKEYFGDIFISELSQKQIEECLQHRVSTSSLYTARKDLINIKASFSWAMKNKYLPENPALALKRIKVPEKLPAYFSKEEFTGFLGHIENEDYKDLVIFAINTGLRQAELINLKKRQIVLKSKYLVLDNRTHITKSKKIRTVPLNETAFLIASKRIEDICPSEYLFTLRGMKIESDYVIKQFAKIIDKAKLNKELHFHSLRHSFASWLVQKGASIYDVSKLLGHADIKTTEIYTHFRDEDFRKAVDLL